jgi:hypothetical protein
MARFSWTVFFLLLCGLAAVCQIGAADGKKAESGGGGGEKRRGLRQREAKIPQSPATASGLAMRLTSSVGSKDQRQGKSKFRF